jgi:hypothetical protein
MDIKTLEALGVSAECLSERIVDQAVKALLYSTGFNPHTEITGGNHEHVNEHSQRGKNCSK